MTPKTTITQSLKEFDHYFAVFSGSPDLKGAGHTWAMFSEKWEAFKKQLTTHQRHGDEANRDPDTLYTYYQLELKNMGEDWDITICETMEEVYNSLKYLDIHFDDDTELPEGVQRQVVITGIPMTPLAFKAWIDNCEKNT